MTKPKACDACPLRHVTTDSFVPPIDAGTAELIVGEAPGEEEAAQGKPFVGGAGRWLDGMLKAARLARSSLCITNTILCRPRDNVYPTDDPRIDPQVAEAGVDYCRRTYLEPLLADRPWSRIIALGNKALHALTGRTGIEQWRGSPLPLRGGTRPVVIPTLHPAYLMRQPELTSVAVRDLRKQPVIPPEYYNLWPSPADLEAFTATRFAFDLEWDAVGNITLCGLSDRLYHAIVVPWDAAYIPRLKHIFEHATDLIGHNIIQADIPHLLRLGWTISARLWDTMLMQHLLQPDMRHSLAFVSSVFTNKPYWKGNSAADDEKGSQWRSWTADDALPVSLGGYGGCTSEAEAFRLYNARDADASYQIWEPLRHNLERHGLDFIYHHVSAPIAELCREMSERGIRIDHTALSAIRADIQREIDELDASLPAELRAQRKPRMTRVKLAAPRTEYVPAVCKGTRDFPHDPAPAEDGWCPKCGRSLKPRKRTVTTELRQTGEDIIYPWNSADVLRRYVASRGLPEQLHAKTKRPTTGKDARKVWARRAPEFYTIDQLKKRMTLLQSFAKPGLIQTDRMYFDLKVHGTATGRLASKARRAGIDMNVQNIPEAMKRLFLPEPGCCFVKADVSQGENILTALLAHDEERLRRLADPSFDEHSWTATACFGVPVTKTNENKHLRQAGKRINHMLNYGASWKKLQEVMRIDGFELSAAECREIIARWREANAVTARWQDETIAKATRDGFLVNPFGRIRWFQTHDIGPKALAFLPSSTLADIVLRMMIAMHATRFHSHVEALHLGTAVDLPDGAYMVAQIHDEIVVASPIESAQETLARMEAVMTQPWPEIGNYAFHISAKICRHNLKE